MKKTLTTLATALIMMISFSSYALANSNPLKNVSSSKMVSIYLKATTMGDTEFNQHLFAADFEYQNMANRDKFNKRQYTNFLKANSGVKYDCKITYDILDETANTCLAKASMKFEHFTRVDFITLVHHKDGWKISKVVTTYP